MDNIENLLDMLQSSDEDEISDAIIDLGKGGYTEYADTIAAFLKHDEPIIRSAAIRVLGFYWQIDKYKDIAHDIFLNDLDDETRSVALMAYSTYFRNKNNKEVMEYIYTFLSDKNEAPIVRGAAHDFILSVSLIPSRDWPEVLDLDNFDKAVNWDLIKKIIEEAE